MPSNTPMRGHIHRTAAAAAVLAATATATAIAACGGSSSSSDTTWSNLTRVTVLSQTAGVPLPPGGHAPKPTVFSTPQQLKTITQALNDNHIHQGANKQQSGCAGGTNITIVITQKSGTKTKLGAYRCANTTYGDIAGNLTGFLNAAGVGN
jgi:7-keto-8-aminopelargonate synthetase-like enzyme